MPDAIFLDTNVVRNKDAQRFFGNTVRLQQISRLAQVYIPSVVIEEIKWQKREKLSGDYAAFKSNYFFGHVRCSQTRLEKIIEERIAELHTQATQELPHIESALRKDENHIDHLLELAIQKRAPFEKGMDKGFKDACIYLTISQHLDDTRDQVFLFTEDGRLKETFTQNSRVKVLKEPDEYFDYRASYFKEDYFLDQLREDFRDIAETSLTTPIRIDDIVSANLNDEDDWIIIVNADGGTWNVKIDFYSKEALEIVSL